MMAISGLSIIGETINDSVPGTHKFFEEADYEGLKALARLQDEKGAAYIDVNVGRRAPDFMAEVVRQIQSVTVKPLSIDSPDPMVAAAGLRAYDREKTGGMMPILNSISPLRPEMLDLYRICPFIPILLVTERMENDVSRPVQTAAEALATARALLRLVREKHRIPDTQCIIDPGIAPIGTDMTGILKRVLESISLIHQDPDCRGAHFSVGLSNFTVMLPSKRADGTPVKGPLESAFLTKAIPLGLDMVIGSVNRSYEILPVEHPAMQCLENVLAADGFDAVMRVKEFYS